MLWVAASVAAALAVLALLAYFVPVPVSLNAQARAEPTGAWAVACGLGLGPLALSVIAAAGIEPFLTCHVFGRQLLRLPLARWTRRAPKTTSEPKASTTRSSRAEHSLAGLLKGVNPVDVLLTWWSNERVFEVRSLAVDLEYSFRDVAFTGRVLAALCVLSAVLPADWEVNQTPSWDSEDRVLLVADARFRIWFGRLVFDVVRFVLKHRSRMRQNAVPAIE